MLMQEEAVAICQVCGEPTELWFEVDGLIAKRKVGRRCLCERKAYEEEQEEAEKQKLHLFAKSKRISGLSDAQYRESTFSMDDGRDEKASRICRRYVEEWEAMKKGNYGLLLYGDVGGGKTFFASCIANALLENGVDVMMNTIPNLEARMNESFRRERRAVLNDVKNAELLILDDVGVGRMNTTALEAAYDIINERYKSKKPLIITTNLPMAAIRDEKGLQLRRIYDRLIELCSPVKVEGLERRREKARVKMEQLQCILDGQAT